MKVRLASAVTIAMLAVPATTAVASAAPPSPPGSAYGAASASARATTAPAKTARPAATRYTCYVYADQPDLIGGTAIYGFGYSHVCEPGIPRYGCLVTSQIQEFLRGRDGNYYWYNKGSQGTLSGYSACEGSSGPDGDNAIGIYTCTPSAIGHYFRTVATGTILPGPDVVTTGPRSYETGNVFMYCQ